MLRECVVELTKEHRLQFHCKTITTRVTLFHAAGNNSPSQLHEDPPFLITSSSPLLLPFRVPVCSLAPLLQGGNSVGRKVIRPTSTKSFPADFCFIISLFLLFFHLRVRHTYILYSQVSLRRFVWPLKAQLSFATVARGAQRQITKLHCVLIQILNIQFLFHR